MIFVGKSCLLGHCFQNLLLTLPSATRRVKALVELETFALRAEDLKFVANQFRQGFGFWEIFRWIVERTQGGGKKGLLLNPPNNAILVFFFIIIF